MLEKNSIREYRNIYIKSLVAGLVVCLLLMLLFSIIMSLTPITEKWIEYYSLGIIAIACLVSGITAGYYKKKRGIINGIIHAIVLIFVLFWVYYFAVENISITNMVNLRHLVCLIFGAIGGMIGVNAK